MRNDVGLIRHLDKYYSPKYIKECLPSLIETVFDKFENVSVDHLASILSPDKSNLRSFDCFIADVVDSSLDIDRIDYLSRDAYASGLPQGLINTEAILDNMVPFKRFGSDTINLVFKESAIPHIEHLLSARDIMFLHCYESNVKVCGDRLLEKATMQFIQDYQLDNHIDQIILLTDQQLISLIINFSVPGSICFNLIKALVSGVNFKEIASIQYKDESWGGDKTLIPDDKSRINIFKQWALSGKTREAFFDFPKSWETEIASKVNLETWQVNIVCSSHELAIAREEQANILTSNRNGYEVREIGEVSDIIKSGFVDILRKARDKIRIFVHKSCTPQQEEKIREMAPTYFLRG